MNTTDNLTKIANIKARKRQYKVSLPTTTRARLIVYWYEKIKLYPTDLIEDILSIDDHWDLKYRSICTEELLDRYIEEFILASD